VNLPLRRLLRSAQRTFESFSDQLTALPHTGLDEQLLHSIFDTTLRQAHVVADFLVGQAPQNALKDILLTVLQNPPTI
jgi:hypothetical protein